MVAANSPTLLFILSRFGLLGVEPVIGLSQVYCVALLMVFGARVGWVLDKRAF
jgi:hypothetical protein